MEIEPISGFDSEAMIALAKRWQELVDSEEVIIMISRELKEPLNDVNAARRQCGGRGQSWLCRKLGTSEWRQVMDAEAAVSKKLKGFDYAGFDSKRQEAIEAVIIILNNMLLSEVVTSDWVACVKMIALCEKYKQWLAKDSDNPWNWEKIPPDNTLKNLPEWLFAESNSNSPFIRKCMLEGFHKEIRSRLLGGDRFDVYSCLQIFEDLCLLRQVETDAARLREERIATEVFELLTGGEKIPD